MAKITETVMQRMEPPAPNSKERVTVIKDDTLSGFQAVCTAKGRKHTEVFKRMPHGGRLLRIKIADWPALPTLEARKQAHLLLAKIQSGIDPIAERKADAAAGKTLRAAIDDYLKVDTLADSTKVTSRRVINQMEEHADTLGTAFLDSPIQRITGSQVKDVHKMHSKESPSCADGAMRVCSAAVTKFINYTLDDDEAEPSIKNPIKVLTRQKLWNHVNPKSRYIETEWIGKWWDACEVLAPDIQWFFRLGLLTGARKSELMGLRWADVNVLEKTITFRGTKNGSDHVLPLTPAIAGCLPIRPKDDTAKVFPSLSDPRIRKAQDKLEKGLGRRWVMHDLRRSNASIANRVGLNEYTIKRLLNHGRSRRDVTLSHYIQFSLEGLAEALTQISDYIDAQVKRQWAEESADVALVVDVDKPQETMALVSSK